MKASRAKKILRRGDMSCKRVSMTRGFGVDAVR